MLSVVVLTYNSSRTIDACLDSLAAQTRTPAEILIVDDDSTDDTLDRVATHADLPIRVVRNGNHNISAGRNIGMAASTNSTVAFLDSDAVAEPAWAAAILDAFAADPAVAIVGGDVVAAHDSPFAEAVAINDGTVRDLFTHGALLVSGCNMALRTDLLDGEQFDERWVHAEDVEFVDRIEPHHRWAIALTARVYHESRIDPRGYLRQMYRYGVWKVRYTAHTGNVRPVDYVPSVVLVGSVALGVTVSPWLLLGYPALSVAETAFVAAYRRAPARLIPRMLGGWLVKNTGWGIGVLAAVGQQVARGRQPAWGR